MVYKLCNCISMKIKGVPLCVVQPYFRGLAVSTSDSHALVFDTTRMGPFPKDSIKVFDGYVEYSLKAEFDIWMDFGLDIEIPKMLPKGKNLLQVFFIRLLQFGN